MSWFRRRNEPDKPLKPGTCECGHGRSIHAAGKGRCHAGYPADDEWPCGAICACQIFILDEDNDGGDDPEAPIDPDVAELERVLERIKKL